MRYCPEVLHQCGKWAKNKSHKVFGANVSTFDKLQGKN